MIKHKKQINVDKNLKHSGKNILAGEDGFVIVDNLDLENITDVNGFLANIEDADEYSNEDILVCTTDGEFGLYVFNSNKNLNHNVNNQKENENKYKLKKLDIRVKDDCIYNMETFEEGSTRYFVCSGERGVVYRFEI